MQDPEIEAIHFPMPGFIIGVFEHKVASPGQFLRGKVAARPIGAK